MYAVCSICGEMYEYAGILSAVWFAGLAQIIVNYHKIVKDKY